MALLTLVTAGGAAADPTAEAVERAVRACEAGDAGAACQALRAASDAVAAQLGQGHPFHQIAASRRAGVCGEPAPSAAPAGRGKPGPRPSPSLARQIRGLAACEGLAAAGGASTGTADAPDPADFPAAYAQARSAYEAGRLDEARQGADAAAALAKRDLDPRRIAESQELRALVAWSQGRAATALRAAQDAAGAATQSGDPDIRIRMARLVARVGDVGFAKELLDGLGGRGLAPATRALLAEARGDLALQVGHSARAVELLEAAVELRRKADGPSSPATATALQRLGDAQRESANFPAASRSYDEALAIRRKALGSDHPATAETLNALGVLRADFDDWAAADAAFQEAARILVAARGAEHPDTLRLALNRGRARWGVAPDAKSLAGYQAAVEKLASALSDDHAGVATALRNLARMNTDLGRLRTAEALYQRTLAAQERTLGPTHPDSFLTRLERARVVARKGALDDAAGQIEAAIAALAESRGREDPLLARYRVELAQVQLALGRPGPAREQALEAARILDRQLQRSFGAMSDRQRRRLADRSQGVLGVLLSLPDSDPREVHAAILPHRDSVVRSIAESQALARSRGGPGAELLAELERARERYVASLLDADPARARALAREIDALEARAAAAGVAGAGDRGRSGEQVVAEACRRLPDDAAVLELIEYDRTELGSLETSPRYVAFVVRGGDCRIEVVRLGPAEPILRSARAFGEAMRKSQNDAPAARAELGRRLLAPTRKALAGSDRWLVVPDAGLWGIPFGALPDPERDDAYLLERVVVGYLTSIHELASAAPSTATGFSRALVVGAPDFGPASSNGPVVLTGAGPCRLPPFDPLPGTETEAREVAAQLDGATVLTGPAASKAALRQQLTRRPSLLHLATHGYFASLEGGCAAPSRARGATADEDAVTPALDPLLLSGVVLADANQGPGEDGQNGILTSSEVASLDLRSARLVVLSACDSGTGSRQRGQEIQGLRWAFRAAGAGALVTSLWRSNDRVTQAMMAAFYEALTASDLASDAFRGAEALRRAKLERIARDARLGMKRPLSWANFVFSGSL